ILRGTGAGEFTRELTLGVGSGPWSLAVLDVALDGLTDIVCCNALSQSVTLLRQVIELPATTTTLAFDPGAVVYGQPLHLTASVAPADATGVVEFLDLGVSLGN